MYYTAVLDIFTRLPMRIALTSPRNTALNANAAIFSNYNIANNSGIIG